MLIALDHRGLLLQCPFGDAELAEETVERAVQYIDAIRSGIRRHGNAISIVQTLARAVEAQFGSLDRAIPGTPHYLVERINSRLVELVRASDDLLLDISGLADTVGLAAWHDPRLWNMAKVPFSGAFLPLYADHVVRLVAALRGKSRRCLVLDLDNTLWGGAVAEDGLEGIEIGDTSPRGEAFKAFQKCILSLKERGVLLAVCSKNEHARAIEPFEKGILAAFEF